MPTAPDVFSHWYHWFEGLESSPNDFYNSIAEALERRSIPDAENFRVEWREGGIFSAKREYLRVTRQEFIFDVCGAPFGNGFFISSWLGKKPSFLIETFGEIAVIGPFVKYLVRPMTYYRIDAAIMFQQAVHASVLEIIDRMATGKGLRTLSPDERKPIMSEYFRKR
jgi:hypothetical protein